MELHERVLPPDSLPNGSTDVSEFLQVPYTLVNSRSNVTSMLDALPKFQSDNPLLSIDLEGLDFGTRKSETYLLQIYDSHSHHLYIVDICMLGPSAFVTPASDGRTTLETILESAEVLKLICDVRGDSYALLKEFGIRLRGIKDVQNFDIASRPDPATRQRRTGLLKLINRHAYLSLAEQSRAQACKTIGREFCRLWGYVQFSVRPLRGDLAAYAGNDVLYLPRIYSRLIAHMSEKRQRSADFETEKSIAETQRPEYDPEGTTEQKTAANWHHQYEDDSREEDFVL